MRAGATALVRWGTAAVLGLVFALAACGQAGARLVTTAQLQRSFVSHGLKTRVTIECTGSKRALCRVSGAPHVIGSVALDRVTGGGDITDVVQAWVLDSVSAADQFNNLQVMNAAGKATSDPGRLQERNVVVEVRRARYLSSVKAALRSLP
jgi:hypothetical protein